jgi:hypothetical protein
LEISNSKRLSPFEYIALLNSSGLSHIFSISKFLKTEDDCDDTSVGSSPTPDLADISRLLHSLMAQLTSQNSKLSNDFHQVIPANDIFKKEVSSEMDELQNMITVFKKESITTLCSGNSTKRLNTPDLTSSPIPNLVTQVSHPPDIISMFSTDQQTQMMLLFANSFSKLSNVLTDKSDSKAEWPKFSGDQKRLQAWYLSIMEQISLPPWVELYDSTTNDIVSPTTNSNLNGKLYATLLLALEGTALKSIVSHKHLCANGLLLLRGLVQPYHPKNVPEVIAFKTSEFWGNTKRFPNESIDDNYNRFHELLDELEDADEPISTKSAI